MEKLLQRRPLLREQVEQRVVNIPMWPVLALEEQLRQRDAMYVPDRFERQMAEIVERVLQQQPNGPGGGGITPLTP